jgi:hypothetical protein
MESKSEKQKAHEQKRWTTVNQREVGGGEGRGNMTQVHCVHDKKVIVNPF